YVTTRLMELAGEEWTFRDVLNIMRSRSRLIEMLNQTEEGRELKELYANEKVFNDVLSTIAARTTPYLIIAALWDRCGDRKLSLNEWVKGQGVLVLGESKKAKETMKTVNRVISERLAQILLDQLETDHKGTRMTYWFNDEATALGDLPMRNDLI